MTKHIKIWPIVVAALFILVLIKILSTTRAISNLEDPYVSCSSERTVFSLSPGQITGITLQNGNGYTVEITDPDEIQAMVEQLNGFHFRYAAKPIPLNMGGWSQRIILTGAEGERSYLFWDHAIEVEDVTFHGSGHVFSDWIDIMNS